MTIVVVRYKQVWQEWEGRVSQVMILVVGSTYLAIV